MSALLSPKLRTFSPHFFFLVLTVPLVPLFAKILSGIWAWFSSGP
jgi:hypothetical protein